MLQNRKSPIVRHNKLSIRPSEVLVRITRRARRRAVLYIAGALTDFVVLALLVLIGVGVYPGALMPSFDLVAMWSALATLGAVLCAVLFWRLCIGAWKHWYDWRDLKRRGPLTIM
jgi:hypothetical protein